MFTIENILEKRAEFENACKDKSLYPISKELISAKTKAEFLQAIFDNFFWVYKHVDKFGLEYDYVGNFIEGYAVVEKNNKFGFINKKFKEICNLEYDDFRIFHEGFADVKKGDGWGKLYPDGREEF